MNYNYKHIYGTKDGISLLLVQMDFRCRSLPSDCQWEVPIS